MAQIEPPPTYDDPVRVDERTKRSSFSPIWLNWFLKVAKYLSDAGASGGGITHNNLTGLQGGSSTERYHLTAAQQTDLTDAGDSALHFHSADRNSANFTGTNWTDLTDGGDSALHFHASDRARANHTGTQTMATISDLPTLASGTYTPTLTNVANLTASTAYQCQWLRVGGTVTVSGQVDVDPTAAASTQLGISLPVASNFGAAEDCGGVASASAVAGQCAAIRADAANDRAEMIWVAVDLTNQPMYFTFTYQVI